MSNRSPKRSLLTERNVRSVIREEINTRYGNRLTARQKAVLEEGILDAMKGIFGGVKNAAGVAGTQAAGLAKKATNAVGTAAIQATNAVGSAVGNAAANTAKALQAAAKPVTDSLKTSGEEIAKAFATGKIPSVEAAIQKLTKDLAAARAQLAELQKNATPTTPGAEAAEAADVNKFNESMRRKRRI